MKFILKLLSTIKLATLPVTATTACDIEQVLPQTFTAKFDKINKFNVAIINKSLPVMDLKLYKYDVINPTGFLINSYNKDKYIKIEISGKIFVNLLNVYHLTIDNTEKEIKNKLNNTIICNGNIVITKYAPYVNFYYLNYFSGKI